MTQLLLQSSEDCPSHPLEEIYEGYSKHMYFLRKVASSTLEIFNETRGDWNDFLFVNVNFDKGYYMLDPSPTMFGRGVKRHLTFFISVDSFDTSFTYSYDLYLAMKLGYDNSLR